MTANEGYTAQQIREAEAPHLAAGEPLMRRAAHGLAREVLRLVGHPGPGPGEVLVLVGSGDNGGDALFAAAELAESGCAVHVVGVGSRMHGAGRAAALAAGVGISSPDPVFFESLPRRLGSTAVVIDGILGIGATGGLRGPARETVAAVLAALSAQESVRAVGEGASAHAPAVGERPVVVAVDLPSGVDSDSGEADDVVLPADVTVTLGGVKRGLLRGRGAELAGDVMLVEIGVEDTLHRLEATAEPT